MDYSRKKYFDIWSLAKLVWKGIVIMFLPAIMVSYSANLLDLEIMNTPAMLLSFAISGVLLGMLGGLMIESKVRKVYTYKWILAIKNIKENIDINYIQLCSRDLTTIYERISWYAQDIFWVCSLLLILLVGLFWTYTYVGLIISFGFCLLLFILYCGTIDWLITTRKNSITGFDKLLEATQNAHNLNKMSSYIKDNFFKKIINENKYTCIYEPVMHFYKSRSSMLISKSIVGIHCLLLCDIIILTSLFWGISQQEKSENIVLIITILLLIKGYLVNTFFAVTGFKSHAISVDRLEISSQKHQCVRALAHKNEFMIPAFSSIIDFKNLSLKKGHIYHLSADSGSGKTTYMKCVSNIMRVNYSDVFTQHKYQDVKIVYIDSGWEKYVPAKFSSMETKDTQIQILFNLVKKIIEEHKRPIIICLDEILNGFGEQEKEYFLNNITKFIKNTEVSVIISDHSVAGIRTIKLLDLIETR